MASTLLKWLLRGSRSVVPNRLDEPDAMAPTAPPETLKHVLEHNCAQKAVRELSLDESESSRSRSGALALQIH